MLKIASLTKTYNDQIEALRGVDLEIAKGEFVVVLGRSGSGKSTLIRCINGLVQPEQGEIHFDRLSVITAGKKQLAQIRKEIGMIFQQFNLVERISVLDNVLTGRLGHSCKLASLLKYFGNDDYLLAVKALERVELIEYAHKPARELSGGQQQRVAIARALVQEPKLILGDEPVASLDPVTAKSIMGLLKDINRNEKISVILNMHAVELGLEYADRVIGLKSGKVAYDGPAKEVTAGVLEEIYG